ncbi:hypothetical protein LA080_013135 [Diaporthe eres]|nr:hypothetical protein LA080_013135 [Diaporthe eres]
MDPLSAISLASAVILFIDFGCQITSEAHEIYRSSHGLTEDFEEIQDACERSKELTEAIKSTVNATDHEGLQTLADSCLETAGEITTVLNRLKASSSGGDHARKFKSIRKAFVQYRGKDKVEELNKKLQSHRRDLSDHIIFLTRQSPL